MREACLALLYWRKIMRLMSLLLLFISSVSYANDLQRLVSIDGAITEIIYQLNAEKSLVAVDSTSLHPQIATKLPNVGYMRALSAEGVLSVQPTDIITTKDAGSKEALEQLKQAGVNVHIIDRPYSADGVKNKITDIGKILNKQSQARELIIKFDQALVPLLQQLSKQKTGQTALFFLGMQGNQLMAAGMHTQADALLQAAQLKNANGNSHGYKPLNKEAVLSINPDIIIIASNPGASTQGLKEQFIYSKAFANNKILVASTDDLLGFGPRFPEALEKVLEVAYP